MDVTRNHMSVAFKVGAATAVITAAAVILGLANWYPDQIKFASEVVVASGTLYSAFYIALTLHIGVERDRMSKALDFVEVLSRPEFMDTRTAIVALIPTAPVPWVKGKLTVAAATAVAANIREKIANDAAFAKNVRYVLNELERFALGVEQKYVHELIARECLSTNITLYWETLHFYVDDVRSAKNDPIIYKYLEKLAIKWQNVY